METASIDIINLYENCEKRSVIAKFHHFSIKLQNLRDRFEYASFARIPIILLGILLCK